MDRKVVPYKKSDGANGIEIAAGQLQAVSQGELVDSNPVNPWADLDDLISSYQVLQYLPGVSFSLKKSKTFDVVLTMEYIVGNEINGWIWIDGEQFPWAAEWTRDAIFAKSSRLPEGVRKYAKDDPEYSGWKIILAPPIATNPDAVFSKRVALVVEEFLYVVESGDDSSLQLYSKKINNTMSAGNPMWNIELPNVAK